MGAAPSSAATGTYSFERLFTSTPSRDSLKLLDPDQRPPPYETGKSNRPDKPDKPDRAGEPDKPNRAADKPNRPAKADKPNNPEKPRKAVIEVRTGQRVLTLKGADGQTIRYRVGVGRAGQQWFGSTRIAAKRLQPAWTPPKVIRGNKPAWVVPGGSPKNPMGAAALVLADHELAIHGTNDPKSIGGSVSWGCIRMQNRDVLDLFKRVDVGTTVVFMR